MTVCFTDGGYGQLSVVFESVMVEIVVKQTKGQPCSWEEAVIVNLVDECEINLKFTTVVVEWILSCVLLF